MSQLPEKSKQAVQMTREGAALAALIAQLADADSKVRNSAAQKLYARGLKRAQRAMQRWFRDPELASCFPLNDSSLPFTIVGIAAHPKTFEEIRHANGSPRLAEVPPGFDAKEFALEFPDGVRLDVITVLESDGHGAIARFLENQGEGIQQVEFAVNSVERATEILRERFGLAPVFPNARHGAEGTKVNFFLVADPAGGKTLIELVEAVTEHS